MRYIFYYFWSFLGGPLKIIQLPHPLAVAGWDWGFRGLSPSQPPQIIFLVFILISHCLYEYFDTNILKIEHKLSSWDFLKDPPPNKKYEKWSFKGRK